VARGQVGLLIIADAASLIYTKLEFPGAAMPVAMASELFDNDEFRGSAELAGGDVELATKFEW
jgi:hypothetical protein